MYHFHSPFGVDYKAFYEVRFEKLKNIKPIEMKYSDESMSIDFTKSGFDSLKIDETSPVQYEFEIKEDHLIEKIKISEKTIEFSSLINKSDIEKFIRSIFTLFAIAFYGILPGGFQEENITKEMIKRAFQDDENFKLKDDEIWEEGYENEKLKIYTSENGFYYFASFYGHYQIRYFNLEHILKREEKPILTYKVKNHLENWINKNKLRILSNI